MKISRNILLLVFHVFGATFLMAQGGEKADILKGSSSVAYLSTNKTYFDYLYARNNLLNTNVTLTGSAAGLEKPAPDHPQSKTINITLNPPYKPTGSGHKPSKSSTPDFFDNVFYKTAGAAFNSSVNNRYRNVKK